MGSPSRGRRLGPYALLRRIAAGGMGEIYLAHQHPDSERPREVAIKVLRREFSEDPQVVQMFINEAKLAGGLAHDAIVQVLDVGTANGRFYIAMEYVDGVSGSALVKALANRRERLSADLLSLIGQRLCEGLQHVHEQKGPDGSLLYLVHRDVNPRNVLVSTRGEVKLTDFGIAKATNIETHTRKGTVKGTLEYLAPEQVRGKPADARVDVYGAGITLYYLATLDSPFWRGSVGPTLEAIQFAPLPSLQILRPDLSPALMRAIEQATDKSPQTRFQTAKELAAALPKPSAEAKAMLAEHVRGVEAPPIDVRPDFEDLSAPKPKAKKKSVFSLESLPTLIRPQLVDDRDILGDATVESEEFGEEAPTTAAAVPMRLARRTLRAAALVAVLAGGAVVFSHHTESPVAGAPCELPVCDLFARASFEQPCGVVTGALVSSQPGALCLGGEASVPALPSSRLSCQPKKSKAWPSVLRGKAKRQASRLAFRR